MMMRLRNFARNLLFIALLATQYSNSAFAACTSPDGAAGDQVYNNTYKMMQFCDGNGWVAMASKSTNALWMENVSTNNIYYNSGNVGIGTDTPATALHVMGVITAGSAIRLSSTVNDCSAAGDIRYNSGNTRVEVCDGTGWKPASSETFSAGSVPFANASGMLIDDAGVLTYDNANDRLTVGKQVQFVSVTGNMPSGLQKDLDLVLADITDVNLSGAVSGHVLGYNGTAWGTRSLPLNDLSDVSLSSPSEGQLLTYVSGNWINSTYAEIWQKNGTSIYYGTGNVGVGSAFAATAPTVKLQVNGDATENLILAESASTTASRIMLKNTSAGGHDWWLSSTGSANAGGVGKLMIYDNTAPAARMTFDTAGNVGIGTSAPEAKLDVKGSLILDEGSGTTPGPVLYTGIGSTELNRYVKFINSPTLSTASGVKVGGVLVADTYSYANPGKNDMVIKGTLSIGGPTALTNLTVGNAANTTTHYNIAVSSYDTTSGYAQFTGNWASPGFWGIGPYSGSVDNIIKIGKVTNASGTWTANDTSLYVDRLIARTNLSTFYDVSAGTIGANSSIYSYGYICVGNSSGACNGSGGVVLTSATGYKSGGGAWADNSDARLKKDISPLVGALDKILELKPVSYKWINPDEHGYKNGTQFGFVAQDVMKIFPDWIGKKKTAGKDKALVKSDKAYTLDLPFGFDAYVVGSIKELAKKNETLEKENAELKDRLNSAIRRLDNLEMSVGIDYNR